MDSGRERAADVATNPFVLPGRWYKGNLHAHTTNSDGRLSPEEVIALYRGAGYDFLSITDHEGVTWPAASRGPGFLLLPGVELNGGRSEMGERFHVLGFGLERVGTLPPESERTTQQAIDWIIAHGGAAVLAHPHWSGHTCADLLRWRPPRGRGLQHHMRGRDRQGHLDGAVGRSAQPGPTEEVNHR